MSRIVHICVITGLLFLSSCAQFFQGKIAKGTDLPGSNLSDLVLGKTEGTKLYPPEKIDVSQALSPDSIFISWEKVSGASYYSIERAEMIPSAAGSFDEPREEDFDTLCQFVYGTSWTDKILKSPSYKSPEYGYRYYYRVSAENPGKKYEPSDFSEPEYGTLFAPVTEISATQGESDTSIVVTWGTTANASSYSVYRSTSSNGRNPSLLRNIPANRGVYTDEIDSDAQGTDFYYSVYAVNSSGYTAPISPIALGYSSVSGAPDRVKNVKVTKGRGDTTGSITIKWDAVDGDDVKYSVYRTSSGDSTSTLLKDKLAVTTYTDTDKNLLDNVYYYYQVLASTVDDEEKILRGPMSKSSASDENPAEGFILSAPSSLSVVQDAEKGGCIVTFPAPIGSADYQYEAKVPASNNYSYRIYASESQSFETPTITTFDDLSPYEKDGYYSVPVDFANFYKVSTLYSDAEGNKIESNRQSPVAAPVPYPVKNLSVTRHDYFQDIKDGKVKANSNGVYPVKITWDAPDGGAGGYYIYRSTSADAGFKKIDETTKTEYVDSYDLAKPGIYYYYRVLSLNLLGQGVNYSEVNEKSYGYGALTYEQYMREYNKTIKNSHKKLWRMSASSVTDKMGSDSAVGDISGTVKYNGGMATTMKYDNYADFYIMNDKSLGVYFCCTGNSDTNISSITTQSGSMEGTMYCEGMYPGSVKYDKIKINGGGAAGGTYIITPDGFESGEVSWTVGEE